jgi:hypothetical protein
MATDDDRRETSDVDFFGVKLKVNNPRLAALLNSSVTDDVQVVGRRARDVVAPEARPARAAPGAVVAEDAAGEATGTPAPD